MKYMDCFRCKFTQILKAIHNVACAMNSSLVLFPMQIYTNFESNSQRACYGNDIQADCFRCKFTQILKAIHNIMDENGNYYGIVSDANLHKF